MASTQEYPPSEENGQVSVVDISTDANSISQVKVCGVCNNNESKYKCSRCEIPYCSVACSTLHRATHPSVAEGLSHAPIKTKSLMTSDAHFNSTIVPGRQNALAVLEDSPLLQTLFMMYPRLRSQLREIYSATLSPPEDPQNGHGQNQDHHQLYRGHARGRGTRSGRGGYQGLWNPDKGIQDGIDSLANAKLEYGKGGEGVKDFCDLVLKIVSVESVGITHLVQDEVAEENVKIIQQLLNGESH